MTELAKAIKETYDQMELDGSLIQTQFWQSWDISKMPGSKMVEVMFHSFMVDLRGEESLDQYRRDIRPNLPWADDHFEERVCGAPINPGVEWINWPWGRHADMHREGDGMFNHNYMERYWPKLAGCTEKPTRNSEEWFKIATEHGYPPANYGIRNELGDLNDMVNQLAFDPFTRQAYLPVWFPEDTGAENKGRKPCTLGYHFIRRGGELSVVYYIRSCDLYRHFRDDIYLTIRLLLWVLEQCKDRNPNDWAGVKPGSFIMHITSLHMFINDYIAQFGCQPGGKL